MFKFNFIDESENTEIENTVNLEHERIDKNIFIESKEIFLEKSSPPINNLLQKVKTEVIKCNNFELKYICPDSVVDFLKSQNSEDQSVLKADQNHSDLLSGEYEGGLKIWECTYDLLNYFNDNNFDFKDKTVLDLGCGAGILGIFVLLKRGTCWFQDYNDEVINNITMPNVLLNEENFTDKAKFFSGDWESFGELIENHFNKKFDYIFSSETIYNTNYYPKLHFVFEKLLNKNGVIFLAAKSFYFGVGGGTHLFENFLNSKNTFEYSNCWHSTDGVKRDILKLNFIAKN